MVAGALNFSWIEAWKRGWIFTRASSVLRLAAAGIIGLTAGCASEYSVSVHEAGDIAAPSSSRPVTTAELVEIRGLSGLAVSPDGQYAAVQIDQQQIEINTTRLSWHIIRLHDGRETRIADGGSARWSVNGNLAFEMPQWSADSEWIYYRAVNSQQAQVWRARRDGSRTEQLTHDAADVEAFIISPDGTLHYAVSGATRDEIEAAESVEDDSGTLLDKTVLKGFPISGSFPVNGRMAAYRRLLPAGISFGRGTLLGDRPLRVMTLDPLRPTPRRASEDLAKTFADLWSASQGNFLPFEPNAAETLSSPSAGRTAGVEPVISSSPGEGALSRSGTALWWRTGGSSKAFCRSLICTDADEIFAVGWTTDGRELIFQTRNFGTVGLHAWDVATDAVRTIASSEAALGFFDSGAGGTCKLAASEAICIRAAADLPPRIVAIGLENGRERVLFNPNPDLTADRLGVADKITLTDRFGSKTFARLILPRKRASSNRLPLVITSYGCHGFLLGGSGKDVPEHVLAGLGYAAACVDHTVSNVRRASGYDHSQKQGDESSLDFFEGAIRILDQEGIVDPERVVLTGFSGSATSAVSSLPKSRKFAAVSIMTEAATDVMGCYLIAYFRSCQTLVESEGYSQPFDSHSGYFADSPAWNVEKIGAPLLMQLAEVEYRTMLQLYGAMSNSGRGVEMYIFPSAYHFKNRPRQRLAVYDRNVDWANFWLRGLDAAQPDHRAQNQRWHAMRDKQCKLFAGDNALPDPPWYCR